MTLSPSHCRLKILQVEDNPVDVALTAYALKLSGVPYSVHVVSDGRQAMKFLREGDRQGHTSRPDLILLDVNLPVVDGTQVLRQIKGDAALKAIPVVMFSTSDTDEVQRQAYELQANCFVVKRPELEKFVAAVKAIVWYWAEIAVLASP